MINIIVAILIFSLKNNSIIPGCHVTQSYDSSFLIHLSVIVVIQKYAHCTHTHTLALAHWIHSSVSFTTFQVSNTELFFVSPFFSSNSFPGFTFSLDVVPHFSPRYSIFANIFDGHSASLVGRNNKCVYFFSFNFHVLS